MNCNFEKTSKFWKITTISWTILSAIPVILALFEICKFGISLNSGVLRAITQPDYTCENKFKNFEGKNYLYETTVKVRKPFTGRIPHTFSLKIGSGRSILESVIVGGVNPLSLEYEYGNTKDIVKNFSFRNRYIDDQSLTIDFIFVSPYQMEKQLCDIEVSFYY